MKEEIYALTKKQVPTVLALDQSGGLIIGDSARDEGLKNHRTTQRFKLELGTAQDDSQYEQRLGKAGQRLPVKSKDYWAINNSAEQKIRSFTPLEATEEYLRLLLPDRDDTPKRLIIGEPALPQRWRTHFRSNMKTVMQRLGLAEPEFFPEPFAIYQCYRHKNPDEFHPPTQQTILVIDFGGGTFDCCVVQTAQTGLVSRSGTNSLPIGVESVTCGGANLDDELCKVLEDQAKNKGIRFKETATERANASSGILLLEDCKISLSDLIHASDVGQKGATVNKKALEHLRKKVSFPAGTFHATKPLTLELTGLQLYDEIETLWNKHWGKTLIKCMQEAEKTIGNPISFLDKVILAGGSSRLPFLKPLVHKAIPKWIGEATRINSIGAQGTEVSFGLAVECIEQTRKHSDLSTNQLVSCFQDSLYLKIGYSNKEQTIPSVRDSTGKSQGSGLVYRSLDLLKDKKVKVFIEGKKHPKGILYYWFYTSTNPGAQALNLLSGATSIRIPDDLLPDKEFVLTLKITTTGEISPRFQFSHCGKKIRAIKGQSFDFQNSYVEGIKYLGVDFGTSNSYVSEILRAENDTTPATYPNYTLQKTTKQRLRRLEHRCDRLRARLDRETLRSFALQNREVFVFHNNNIEGNTLTFGETQSVLQTEKVIEDSVAVREAQNLNNAYGWVLENYEAWSDHLPSFVREINKLLLRGITTNDGEFRKEDVAISGVDFTPPPWGSVEPFMSDLGIELAKDKTSSSRIELAVRAHTKVVSIHPFIDGNGRTARLLMSAMFLDKGLPPLILNSNDKNRYISALEKSNKGSLDSLAILFSEILEETLGELEEHVNLFASSDRGFARPRPLKDGTPLSKDVEALFLELSDSGITELKPEQKFAYETVIKINDKIVEMFEVAPKIVIDSEKEKLNAALTKYRDVFRGPGEATAAGSATKLAQKAHEVPRSDTSHTPAGPGDSSRQLRLLLAKKKSEHPKVLAEHFPAWKSAHEMLSREFRVCVDELNKTPEIQNSGYQLIFDEYDMLDETRFDAMWTKREMSRTWFCLFRLDAGFQSSSIMLQFDRRSKLLASKEKNAAPVSCILTIGGEDSGDWQPLDGEAIGLREIGYASGQLIYRYVDGNVIRNEPIQEAFNHLVVDLINVTI